MFGANIQQQLKVRYYLDSNWAFFLGPEFGVNSSNRTVFENLNGSGGSGNYKNTNRSSMLNLGFMKFFRINNNLAPFVGVQYGLGNSKSQVLTENCTSSFKFQSDFDFEQVTYTRDQQVAAITGAEYWLKKGFYVGFQLALTGQFSRTTSARTIVRDNGNIEVVKHPSVSHYNVYRSSNSGLKIGWRFN
jgi:hypothetical protein